VAYFWATLYIVLLSSGVINDDNDDKTTQNETVRQLSHFSEC